MEAKDLMIGDWVLKDMSYLEDNPMYARLDYQPYQIQDGEDIDLACETNCIGDACVYQPIPLTADILKKNGFEVESDEKEDWYSLKDFPFVIVYSKWNKKWYGGTYVVSESDYIEEQFKCEYVHELLHALRLCGIKKEMQL